MAHPKEQMDIFLRQIGEALSPYQLIEESLKFYIEAVHWRIEHILRGRIPFRYPPKEYENAPLEHLIKMFRRHSDNEDLIERLKDALKKRNYIAHNAINHYMEDPTMAESISDDLKKIKDDGYDLIEELRKELKKLRSS
jgi:hypothetical protein